MTEKWLTALRSGEYSQAEGFLNTGTAMCCLGVLAEVRGTDWKYEDGEDVYGIADSKDWLWTALLPEGIASEYGLDKDATSEELEYLEGYGYVGDSYGSETDQSSRQVVLSHLNDSGYSFNDIARVLETLDW